MSLIDPQVGADGDIILNDLEITVRRPKYHEAPLLQANLKAWKMEIEALAEKFEENDTLLARYLWAVAFQACNSKSKLGPIDYDTLRYEYRMALTFPEPVPGLGQRDAIESQIAATALFTDVLVRCRQIKEESELDDNHKAIVCHTLERVCAYTRDLYDGGVYNEAEELFKNYHETSLILLGPCLISTTIENQWKKAMLLRSDSYSSAGSLPDPDERIDYGELFDTKLAKGDPIGLEAWSRGNMSKVHKFLRYCHLTAPYVEDRAKQRRPHERRVRIAVLDTGIDIRDSFFERNGRLDRIKGSFCSMKGLCAKEDAEGHGTHMVKLLMQVAPDADIFVARVFKGTKNIESDLIGPAILHAIDPENWDVDIISMSFGFDVPVEAIQQAIDKIPPKVLLFAAASNEGLNPVIPTAWPARDDSKFFCIQSTTNMGVLSTFSPSSKAHNKFATLGENVRVDDTMRALSGTSMATPIAAGTAALLIDFTRLDLDKTIKNFGDVQKFSGMQAMLVASSESRGNIFYLKPWLVFLKRDWIARRIATYLSDTLSEAYK